MFILAHNSSKAFGGGEIGTVLLLAGLQRRGHRVLMLFRDEQNAARGAAYGIPTGVQRVGGDAMLPDALRLARAAGFGYFEMSHLFSQWGCKYAIRIPAEWAARANSSFPPRKGTSRPASSRYSVTTALSASLSFLIHFRQHLHKPDLIIFLLLPLCFLDHLTIYRL